LITVFFAFVCYYVLIRLKLWQAGGGPAEVRLIHYAFYDQTAYVYFVSYCMYISSGSLMTSTRSRRADAKEKFKIQKITRKQGAMQHRAKN